LSKFAKLFDRYKTYDDTKGRGSVAEWSQAFETRMGLDEARKIMRENDPLAVLGLSSMPDMTLLKATYRKLVMENHPDRGGDPILCKKIIAAFTVLEKKISKMA
jgi:DnaJ-domain-containing protein 1